MDVSENNSHQSSDESSESSNSRDAGDFDTKRFNKEEFKQKITETMKDKGKFKAVLATMRDGDQETIGNIHKYTVVTNDVRRSALTTADEMKLRKTLGNKLSLNQKKKMLSAQRQMANMRLVATHQVGEIDCVTVLVKRRISQNRADILEIEKDGKWVLHPVILGEYRFVMVVNSTILSGKNLLASEVLDDLVCGPVTLIMVEQDVGVVPLKVALFKTILAERGVKFK